MFVIPELHIEKILLHGFDKLSKNVTLIDDLLAQYPQEMVSEAKKYLSGNNFPVVLNWPRTGITLPLVAILNSASNEDPAADAIGDFLGELVPNGTDHLITEFEGFAERGSFQIMCLADDPRAALYISIFVKALLVLNKMDMERAGIMAVTIGTSDLRFEAEMLPEWTNSRLVTLNCLYYTAVAKTSQIINSLIVSVVIDTEETQNG